MPELPIEKVFTDEGDEAESHGCPQHVEDACHVVNVQLATHDFILFIVANTSEPESFQFFHLPWRQGREEKQIQGESGEETRGKSNIEGERENRRRWGDTKKTNRES